MQKEQEWTAAHAEQTGVEVCCCAGANMLQGAT